MFGKIGRAMGNVARAMPGGKQLLGAAGAMPGGKRMLGMAGMADPGGQRRAELMGAMGGGPRGARNAFGGAIKRRGQNGFVAMPEATVAPPAPAPGPAQPGAESMQGAWSAEMATPEPSPYGPSQIRPENAPNRIATRRLAGMQMLGR